MVTNNEYNADTKAYKGMYVSAVLFGIVLVLNIAGYFYNSVLSGNRDDLETKISQIDQSMTQINNDPKVKLYTLVQANKVFLDKYAYLSRVPEFLNNLKALSQTFSITFSNFSYVDGKITTSVVALDDGVSFGYQKAKKFISSFRNIDPKSAQIFALDFVDYFEGQNEVKFNVTFKIK